MAKIPLPKMDEFTKWDHESMKISYDDEIELRAMNVWFYGLFQTEEEQKMGAKMYSLTWEQALKWKDHWLIKREWAIEHAKPGHVLYKG